MKLSSRKEKLAYGILIMAMLVISELASASLMPPDRAKELQARGHKVDNLEQIVEVTQSQNHYERFIALELLTQKFGNQAKPSLKKALKDSKLSVRRQAAHELGILGDNSGLVQMRKDFKDLTPSDKFEFMADPDSTEEIGVQRVKWNVRVGKALESAIVLAELGDTSGYKLAAKMAIEGEGISRRFPAVMVLFETAKMDKTFLKKEGLDPMFILKAAVESEKNRLVFALIINQAQINLDKSDALEILEMAKDNNNQSENLRRFVQQQLDKLKKVNRNSFLFF